MFHEARSPIEDELPVDPLKPENAANAATENDPEGDLPWEDDEAAVRTIAMSAPEIDSNIPSPISSPPPGDDGGQTVALERLPPSLAALAAAVLDDETDAFVSEDADGEEAEIDDAEIEDVQEVDDDPPRPNSAADAVALREKLRAIKGLAPLPAAPPRPGAGPSPSVPRAATALAAPLGFGPGRGGAASTAVAADDDAATHAVPREAFLGANAAPAAALQSNHPEDPTRALSPNPAGGGGVFAWGRGAAVAESPPSAGHVAPPISAPQAGGGFPAPAPSFPQPAPPGLSSPADLAQRTSPGSAPGVPSHPGGVAGVAPPGMPVQPGMPLHQGAPAHLTRTGGWQATGPHAPWGQPLPVAPQAMETTTGQVFLFIAIGVFSLAIFVIGVVLFVTTKF